MNLFIWRKMGKLIDSFSQTYYRKFTNAMLERSGIFIEGSPLWISSETYFDLSGDGKIHLGDRCVISHGVRLLTHDFSLDRYIERHFGISDFEVQRQADVKLGKQCFIGMGAIILPGVKIGDGAIVAAGSVVTKNVGDDEVVAGNPAKAIGTTEGLWLKRSNLYLSKKRRL